MHKSMNIYFIHISLIFQLESKLKSDTNFSIGKCGIFVLVILCTGHLIYNILLKREERHSILMDILYCIILYILLMISYTALKSHLKLSVFFLGVRSEKSSQKFHLFRNIRARMLRNLTNQFIIKEKLLRGSRVLSVPTLCAKI